MTPETGVLAWLLLWGVVAGLDGTALCQLMISRPLVAATLAGVIAGSPERGAAVGLLLEALQLSVAPVGAGRFPESGPAAVVAGGAYAMAGGGATLLITAVLFALLWETVGGYSVHWLRTANVRVASVPTGQPVSVAEMQARHGLAVALDALRALVLVATGLWVARALLQIVAVSPALSSVANTWASWGYWAALGLLLAAVGRSVAPRRIWLLSGVLGGAVLAWLR